MVALLSRIFIRNHNETSDPAVRSAYGVLCGILGIFFNLLLFAGKFIAGSLAGSIAVTADAFNNLSDAASSLIMIVGFALANRKPNPKHPFGHGRIEYLAGLLVSAMILMMGFELGKSSFEKILSPELPQVSFLTAGILIASILVKCYMFLYNRGTAKKIHSEAMSATAADSLTDCISTLVVLVSSVIGALTSVPLDGWCGLLVALFIVWSGLKSAVETISPLLGQAPDEELVREIEKIVREHDAVKGIHDLVVHNYGPGRQFISLHAEVPSNGDIMVMHDEIDNIEQELFDKLRCQAIIHMDPIQTDDEKITETRERIAELVRCIDERLMIHDFRMVEGPTHVNVIFDLVIPFDNHLDPDEIEDHVKRMVRVLDANYYAVIHVDRAMTN